MRNFFASVSLWECTLDALQITKKEFQTFGWGLGALGIHDCSKSRPISFSDENAHVLRGYETLVGCLSQYVSECTSSLKYVEVVLRGEVFQHGRVFA